jgi:AcrR family transcriptional regulator
MAEFGAKGFKEATMKSIAAAAGVSVGLVQHHFGTKAGLRHACDEAVLDMVRVKVEATQQGTIGDARVLSGLMARAPQVQRYLGRALVDGSDAIFRVVDEVMDRSEDFLTDLLPETFTPGDQVTRDAAAVMTAINTSIMMLQPLLGRRMGFEPWTTDAVQRVGIAMFDVFEAFGEIAQSEMWRKLRAGVDDYRDKEKVDG